MGSLSSWSHVAMDSTENSASDFLKCGTQMLPRTPARSNLLRDRKRAPLVKICSLTLTLPPDHVEFLVKVLSYVRQRLGRPKGDKIEHVITNPVIWGLLLTESMKAAVHLGQDFGEKLRATKNTGFSEIKLLFTITQNLIRDQEIEYLECVRLIGIKPFGWEVFVAWGCNQVIDSKSLRLLRFGALFRLWSLRSIYWTRHICVEKWLRQKVWTSLPEHQTVMYKQLTPVQHALR